MSKSTANMVAMIQNDKTGTERELAIPPGLDHEQAVVWCQKWLGVNERVGGFATYK